MKAFITDYQNYCLLCGKPKDASHHLIFGTSHRKLADEDAITYLSVILATICTALKVFTEILQVQGYPNC